MKHSVVSVEDREKIIHALDVEDILRASVAKVLNIPYSTVNTIYNRFNKSGEVEHLPIGEARHKILPMKLSNTL